MNKRHAAIVSAHTALCFGADFFASFHKYAEEKFGRAIWPFEMCNEKFWSDLKELSKSDFQHMIQEMKDD